ncbi:DUF3096 domain-containing protein [Emcibacter sp. SYSU 3D8]|uniref:DUF3096 domain-containing protein n=1 Tax=Emcibacter sp. SYSU 3D8 TaxID=3133969 RepID=UPI0031FE70DD
MNVIVIQPLIALIAGTVILLVPKSLNYVIAISRPWRGLYACSRRSRDVRHPPAQDCQQSPRQRGGGESPGQRRHMHERCVSGPAVVHAEVQQ